MTNRNEEYKQFTQFFVCIVKDLSKNNELDMILEDNNNSITNFCTELNIISCANELSKIPILPHIDVDNKRESDREIKRNSTVKKRRDFLEKMEIVYNIDITRINKILSKINVEDGCIKKKEDVQLKKKSSIQNLANVIYISVNKINYGLYVLYKFREYKLLNLNYSSKEYMLLDGNTLTWNNIKNLKDGDNLQKNDYLKYLVEYYKKTGINVIDIYRVILWYFRKLIVLFLI